jgi:hypothetical protein
MKPIYHGIRYNPTNCPRCGKTYDINRQSQACPHASNIPDLGGKK